MGGTPSGYWLSEEMYARDAACKTVADEFAKTYPLENLQKKYPDEVAAWEKAVEAAKIKPN